MLDIVIEGDEERFPFPFNVETDEFDLADGYQVEVEVPYERRKIIQVHFGGEEDEHESGVGQRSGYAASAS